MIKSSRSYGIEVEIDALDNNLSDLSDSIEPYFHLTTDSSILGQNPIEIVSGILYGKDGEIAIVDMCDTVNGLGVDTTGINSGFHVHVGANDFLESNALEIVEPEDINPDKLTYFASFAALRLWNRLDASQKLNNEHYLRFFTRHKDCMGIDVTSSYEEGMIVCYVTDNIRNFVVITNNQYEKMRRMDSFDDMMVFLQSVKNARPRGKYARVKEDNTTVEKLKNVLLTYVVFNDVISGMVPNSRKENNSYCRRVSDTYSVEEILAVKTVEDFQKLWYLTDSISEVRDFQREHYNNSRYQDVNLHSIWNRTNTIEIRSHKSTLEPKLILNWIKFHQLIVDSVASGKLNQGNILPATKLKLGDKVLYLLDILGADEKTSVYVKTLINHYNYLSL